MDETNSSGRRRCLGLLAGCASTLLTGCAATPAEQPPEEGFEYLAVPQVHPVSSAGGQVIEFFWFGCPHCNALEPLLQTWRRSLPGDATFRKVHVALGPRWIAHQQLFYALEAIGRSDDMNDRVFRALHVDGMKLDERERIADFIAGQGVRREQFLAAFDSRGVQDEMTRAGRLAEAYGVKGVPNFGVNGRWLTSPTMAGGNANALKVVDLLLRRDRASGAT